MGICIHPLENRVATVKPGIPTFTTTNRTEYGSFRRDSYLNLEVLGRRTRIHFFAVRAQDTHQTLREHCFERGSDKVWFHPHVYQAGEGPSCIVGVEGGKNQ